MFPDSQIIGDVRRVLSENEGEEGTEVEMEGHNFLIPFDVQIKVISKALFKDDYNASFGVYRAQVAIGDVTSQEYGIVTARYCFATLYYDENRNLITIDFHLKIR